MAVPPDVACRQKIVSIGEHKSSENSLQSLPDELIWHICIHLDDVTPISQTCKRMLGVTRDEAFRANFLWRLHGPQSALFYAIAKRKILSPGLILTLMQFGAKIPLFLCQELTARFSPPSSVRRCLIDFTNFATDLPWESQKILLQACHERSGDARIIQMEDGALRLEKALNLEGSIHSDVIGGSLPSNIREIIVYHELAPLPLYACPRNWDSAYVSRPSHDVRNLLIQATVRWPDVAKALVSTSFKLPKGDREDVIITLLLKTEHFPSKEVFRCIKALLDIDNADFAVTEILARDIMYSSRQVSVDSWRDPEKFRLSSSLRHHAVPSGVRYSRLFPRKCYDVLRLLDKNDKLKFDFKTVLADTVEMLATCPDVDPELTVAATATFVADFPDIELDGESLWARLWRSRQNHSNCEVQKCPKPSIENIRSTCEGLKITEDILCETFYDTRIYDDTGLLDFAVKYVEIKDWRAFVAKIIRVTLLLPFKGTTLLALDRWLRSNKPDMNLRAMLAREIQRHSLDDNVLHDWMPLQQWSIGAASCTWTFCGDMQSAAPQLAGIRRSLLGLDGTQGLNKALKHGSETLLLSDSAFAQATEDLPQTVRIKRKYNDEFPPDGSTGLSPLPYHSRDVREPSKYDWRWPLTSIEALCAHQQEASGSPIHNAMAVAAICGVQSPASRICLDQAFLSLCTDTSSGSMPSHSSRALKKDQAPSLLDAMVHLGCVVEPHHLAILCQSGCGIPSSVVDILRRVPCSERDSGEKYYLGNLASENVPPIMWRKATDELSDVDKAHLERAKEDIRQARACKQQQVVVQFSFCGLLEDISPIATPSLTADEGVLDAFSMDQRLPDSGCNSGCHVEETNQHASRLSTNQRYAEQSVAGDDLKQQGTDRGLQEGGEMFLYLAEDRLWSVSAQDRANWLAAAQHWQDMLLRLVSLEKRRSQMRLELAKEFCDTPPDQQETLTKWRCQVEPLLEQRRCLIKAVQDARLAYLADEVSWLYKDIETHYDLSNRHVQQLMVHWQGQRGPRAAKRKRLFYRASMMEADVYIRAESISNTHCQANLSSISNGTVKLAHSDDLAADSDDPDWAGSLSDSSGDESESDAGDRTEGSEPVTLEQSNSSRKATSGGATAKGTKRRKKGGRA